MCTSPIFLSKYGNIPFPCGKCLECCLAYSRVWTGRCMDEASLHDENCVLTLTYENTDGNLCKRDFQLFMKRLRKAVAPVKIRFFACGEYGGKNNRPHFHVIIFGWQPDDLVFHFRKKGINYYKSAFVANVWQNGFIVVSPCTEKAIKYSAKYLTKLDIRFHEVPPFTLMSRRPGIGAGAITDSMAVTGLVYRNDKSFQIPKFYLDKLEKMGYNIDVIKARRTFVAKERSDTYLDPVKLAKRRFDGEQKLKNLNGVKK